MQSTMGIGHWPCAAPELHNAEHTVSTFKGLPCVGVEWGHASQFLRQTTRRGWDLSTVRNQVSAETGPEFRAPHSQPRSFKCTICLRALRPWILQAGGPLRGGLILPSSRVSGCWQRQQPVMKNASQPEADPARRLLA